MTTLESQPADVTALRGHLLRTAAVLRSEVRSARMVLAAAVIFSALSWMTFDGDWAFAARSTIAVVNVLIVAYLVITTDRSVTALQFELLTLGLDPRPVARWVGTLRVVASLAVGVNGGALWLHLSGEKTLWGGIGSAMLLLLMIVKQVQTRPFFEGAQRVNGEVLKRLGDAIEDGAMVGPALPVEPEE